MADFLFAELRIGRPATVSTIRNHFFDGQSQIIALVLDPLRQDRALVPGTSGCEAIRNHAAVRISAKMCFVTELSMSTGPRYQGRIRVRGADVCLVGRLATSLARLEIVVAVLVVL